MSSFSPDINGFLIEHAFAWLVLFCRVGAAMMFMPGVGEVYVPARARLLLALGTSLLLLPVLLPEMPPVPSAPAALTLLLTGEIVIGLFFGAVARIILAALHITGMTYAFQSGLASAQFFDQSQGTQGSVFTAFLTVISLVLVFTLDLHHGMLAAVQDSYFLARPGAFPAIDDMSGRVVEAVSETFRIGVQLAAPVLVVALVLNLGSGILARLMPAMPVFFVVMPVQLVLGFSLLMLTLSSFLLYYMEFADERLTGIFNP